MEPTPTIIAALLDLLKALGVNQRKVAAQLGVTPGMVSHWRTGLHPLTRPHQTALQQLLDRAVARARDADDSPARRAAVDRAFKTYRLSISDTLNRLSPGRGFHNLYAEAEACGQRIAQYMARGAASWRLGERIALQVTAQQLDRTLALINLLQPLEKLDTETMEEEGHAENTDSEG